MAQNGSISAHDLCQQIRALQARHECQLAEMRSKHQQEVAELQRQIRLQSGSTTGRPEYATGQSVPTDVHFMDQKAQFIEFVKGVEKGRDSREFRELYNFLIKCFTDADNNFDGRLGFKEFEVLIEKAASLPRRFGYAPSTPEMYATEWDRLQKRMMLFNSLGPKNTPISEGSPKNVNTDTKHISLDTWLEYAISHIREKASKLEEVDTYCKMSRSKEDFKDFIVAACQSRKTREYKELYIFVLKCFTDADTDLDGRIDADSFHSLVDIAAAAPRMFGFAPPASEIYATEEELRRTRMDIFRSLDPQNTGFIDFDSWLHYIYTHICEKTALLGESGRVPEVLAASSSTGNSVCPYIS
mmetsp:Transcript_52360/g.150905  ORF Transcript_52360/g.150905 Transcript_52360/m.150905 type:complete len:357 (-) Transcript_52360:181-1251(-)